MVIIETENYLIFNTDELTQQCQWNWKLTPYRPNGVRNVDETNPNPRNHSRETLTTIVEDVGVEVWEGDEKEGVAIGDKNTYITSNNLRNIAENSINHFRTLRGEAIDPEDEVVGINFVTEDGSKYLPNNDVFIIIRKVDIYTYVSDFGGNPLIIDTFREIRNSRDEVDQFIRDQGETVEGNNYNPQTWTVNTPPFTIRELMRIGNVYSLVATNSFFVNGQEIINVNIASNNPAIEVGNTIKVNGVRIGLNQSRIVGENIDILTHFDNVEIVEPVTGGIIPPLNNNPNNNNPENQANIQAIREQAIQLINRELLAQEKYTINNDDLNKKNWENLINNSNDVNYIENLKREVIADIRGKRKEKIDNDRLHELVQKAQGIEDYEELKKEIENIEEFRGQESYNSLEIEISALKKKLAELNPKNYLSDNIRMIEEEMRKKGVKKDELDANIKEILEKLENEELTEPAEIDVAKSKISDNIYQISAKKKIDELVKKYQKAPDEVSRKIIRTKLLDFISNKNSFYREAYQNRKSEVDKMLKISNSQQNSKSDFPLVPVMIISSFFLLLISLAVIVRRGRINQKRKNDLKNDL